MTIRGLMFAAIGLIVSMWLFGSWIAADMQRIRQQEAQQAGVTAPVPGAVAAAPPATPGTSAVVPAPAGAAPAVGGTVPAGAVPTPPADAAAEAAARKAREDQLSPDDTGWAPADAQ